MATLVAAAALVAATRTDARRADPPVAPRVDLMVRAPVQEQIDHDATVRRRIVRAAKVTDHILPARLVMATAPIQVGPPAMATDPIPRVPHAMVIHVPVAMAIARTLRDLPATVTDPILLVLLVMATVLAQTGRVAIGLMVTDRAGTGSPKVVSDVHSVRR